MKREVFALLAISAASMGHPAFAEQGTQPSAAPGTISEALEAGEWILDARYRFESKDQDGFAEDAYANTLRTRFGFETGEFYHFKFLLEVENVVSLGDDHYNSTTNGRGQFPVIADPETTELNRAQLTYTGIPSTTVTLGRQRYNLSNQRFVGAVGFRQNEQTFDAVRVANTYFENLTVEYAYIDRVHRIFGDDNPLGEFDSDSHILSASYNAGKAGKISAYAVLLDFDEAPTLSSKTWGVRYENSGPVGTQGTKVGIVAEYATQQDNGANPFSYDEGYLHGELSVSSKPLAAKVGYERLGGNGSIGFSTPLATLHKFQGYADVFLNTPTNGIEDLYGSVSYSWENPPVGQAAKLFVTYHSFDSDRGGLDFGEEIDAGFSLKLDKRWSAELKAASYNGNSGFADRDLLWLSLQYRH